jgi:hypothetical protein
MNEPRRWLDHPDALSPDELRVLEAGLDAEVPMGVKAAVKSALLAQLPAPAPGPSPENVAAPEAASLTPGVSTVATATLGTLLKSIGLGFALSIAASTSWVSFQRGEEGDRGDTRKSSPPLAASVSAPGIAHPVGASSVLPASPSSEAHSRLRERDATTVLPSEMNPREAHTGMGAPPGQAPSVSTFPEVFSTPQAATSESSRLAQARALLRNNDARAAFAALESLRRDLPGGALVQEREVLTIEALHAMGNVEAARTRARDFLARHPKSPHAASARRVLERSAAPSP